MQRPKHIELTGEQSRLVEELKHWYRHSTRQWYSYTGPAGTGKTTVVRKAIEELGIERYVTCAFVGKAVTVLARQGLPASTIHSLIYNVVWVPVVDDKGSPVLNQDGNPKMRVEFSLKPSLKDDPQLIIVDEATMVNDDLAEDILSFGIKTVFIGDNNQLPPVFGISSVMANPDFFLTKIMRQAEDSPIIYLSQRVLNHQPLIVGQYGSSRVLNSLYLGSNYEDYDAIIAAKNQMRDAINQHIRKNVLHIRSDLPVIGDKLICRQNDWDRSVDGNIYLTTGMSGTVVDCFNDRSSPRYMTIDFQPDITDSVFYSVQLDTRYIKMNYEDRKLYGISRYEKFEYGYAITCHASQGSQYNSVLFLNQWFHDADLTRKIQYTAITRAVDLIDIVYEILFV